MEKWISKRWTYTLLLPLVYDIIEQGGYMEAIEKKIRNVLREEFERFEKEFFVRFKFESLPYISEEEQRNIEKLYGDELLENDETDIVHTTKLKI